MDAHAQTSVSPQGPSWSGWRRAGVSQSHAWCPGRPKLSVSGCSLSKYGFRASGVRTGASGDRAEAGLLPRFLSSGPKRPSQEARRDLASGERFSGFPAPGQSTGLPLKPQETCHSARRLVRRRARLVWELAEEVHPDSNRRRPLALERAGVDATAAGGGGRGGPAYFSAEGFAQVYDTFSLLRCVQGSQPSFCIRPTTMPAATPISLAMA